MTVGAGPENDIQFGLLQLRTCAIRFIMFTDLLSSSLVLIATLSPSVPARAAPVPRYGTSDFMKSLRGSSTPARLSSMGM